MEYSNIGGAIDQKRSNRIQHIELLLNAVKSLYLVDD